MSLSETSYEILSDLLVLRLEAFLVTSTDEARELKMLRQCQKELENLHGMGTAMALPAPAKTASTMPAQTETQFAAAKLPRRLQRLIQSEAKRAG